MFVFIYKWRKNAVFRRPADVKRLAALREQAAANTWSGKNNRGESDPRACAAAIAAGGFWAPWVN
jgi:hypothetical protein